MTLGSPVWGAAVKTAGSGTANVPYPATVNAGDLLLMFATISVGTINYPTTPTDWNLIDFIRANTSSPTIRAFWTIADGTESGSLPVTMYSATPNSTAIMVAIPGADPDAPIEDYGVFGTSSTTTGDKAVPALDTAVDDCQVFGFASVNRSTATWVGPTGWDEVLDDQTFNPSTYAGWDQLGAAGSTGALVFDHTGTPRGCAFAVAVRPAPDPPPGPVATLWDGSSEQAVTLTVWDGSSEQAVTIELAP